MNPCQDRAIDLNADLGEGFGVWRLVDDAALLDIVSTANIACGFHAGDPAIMAEVCQRAAERGVSVGAHVSYRDLAGFGRRAMDVDPATIRVEIIYQIGALAAIADSCGLRLRHVKPHGALYHAAVRDRRIADAVVSATRQVVVDAAVIGPPIGELATNCRANGTTYLAEGFADRPYDDRGALVSRAVAGGVHTSAEAVSRQAVALASGQPFPAASGQPLALSVRTICLHGDTPNALDNGRRVRLALEAAGYTIRPAVA